ncbi:MAG: hypothetical protein ACXWN9_13300 [Candidatus Binataceae bacterium]
MAALDTPVSAGSMVQAPHASVVAWGAITAGAVATVTMGIILLTLGAGVGLSAASPWPGEGASAQALGKGAVAWMVVVQWLSAAMGGYLAGRLRLRWNYYDRDEVYFRDTAHGFLAWALAVAVVAMFAGTLAGIAGTATATAGVSAAASQARNNTNNYYTDSLFRADLSASASTATDSTSGASMSGTMAAAPAGSGTMSGNAEANRIMMQGLAGDFSQDDRTYLAQMVSRRTGIPQDAAQKRVDQVINNAKQAADKARKAAAALAIATALSLIVGAFISAVAAGYGGRLRDE